MPTAEELIVAIKSEGVGETRQDLEGVERAMQDTAAEAGAAADELQGFSERFQGAMAAAVAALAVGAAGLLSQVPVLGEAFSGLGAIVEAVALQLDQVLRPAISPLTNLFFDISNAIFQANGALGDFFGLLAAGATIGAPFVALLAKAGSMMGIFESTVAGVSTILGNIASSLVTVGKALASFVAGSTSAAVAVGALIGILGVAVLEVTGVLDAVQRLGRYIGSTLPAWARDGLTALSSIFIGGFATLGAAVMGFVEGTLEGGFVKGLQTAFKRAKQVFLIFTDAWLNTFDRIVSGINSLLNAFITFGQDLAEWASGLASDAYGWGVSLIQSLINGIMSIAESVVQAMENVVNGMIDVINDTISQLPQEVRSRLDVSQIQNISVNANLGENVSTSTGGNPSPGPGRGGSRFRDRGMTVDGRQLTESTGRYRSDPGRRRGL